MEKELENYLKGKWLGNGIYRTVYVFAPNPLLVLKIANDDNSGREVNLLENRIYWEMSGTPYEKWFAPVISVSDAGKYLLQKRVEMPPKNQYPKLLPYFFTDTKYSNFGLLDGNFVCCDLGSFMLTRGVSTKMKKVDWWE